MNIRIATQQSAIELLHQMIGVDKEFRPGQWEAIEAVAVKKQRALVVQRTGWGKSLVYFLATRLLRDAGAGPTLLISPLLSLMRIPKRSSEIPPSFSGASTQIERLARCSGCASQVGTYPTQPFLINTTQRLITTSISSASSQSILPVSLINWTKRLSPIAALCRVSAGNPSRNSDNSLSVRSRRERGAVAFSGCSRAKRRTVASRVR